jgi:AcrR family transcriptional regulator
MENESARVAAAVPRRRGPASTENGQRSRDRVLQAALDLITEAGIDQVRVAEIARRAGMSSGQVMYYFTSKEHILLETLVWQDGQDIERTRAALREVTGAWRRLKQFIGFYLPASPTDSSWILWMEVWARAPHNRQVSQLLEEQLRLWRDELAAIVDRGVREGAFTPPAALDDFTLRFTALLDGLAILRLRRMHQPSRKRLIDLAMATARAELAGAARPAAAAPADPAALPADPAALPADPAALPADPAALPADPATAPAD